MEMTESHGFRFRPRNSLRSRSYSQDRWVSRSGSDVSSGHGKESDPYPCLSDVLREDTMKRTAAEKSDKSGHNNGGGSGMSWFACASRRAFRSLFERSSAPSKSKPVGDLWASSGDACEPQGQGRDLSSGPPSGRSSRAISRKSSPSNSLSSTERRRHKKTTDTRSAAEVPHSQQNGVATNDDSTVDGNRNTTRSSRRNKTFSLPVLWTKLTPDKVQVLHDPPSRTTSDVTSSERSATIRTSQSFRGKFSTTVCQGNGIMGLECSAGEAVHDSVLIGPSFSTVRRRRSLASADQASSISASVKRGISPGSYTRVPRPVPLPKIPDTFCITKVPGGHRCQIRKEDNDCKKDEIQRMEVDGGDVQECECAGVSHMKKSQTAGQLSRISVAGHNSSNKFAQGYERSTMEIGAARGRESAPAGPHGPSVREPGTASIYNSILYNERERARTERGEDLDEEIEVVDRPTLEREGKVGNALERKAVEVVDCRTCSGSVLVSLSGTNAALEFQQLPPYNESTITAAHPMNNTSDALFKNPNDPAINLRPVGCHDRMPHSTSFFSKTALDGHHTTSTPPTSNISQSHDTISISHSSGNESQAPSSSASLSVSIAPVLAMRPASRSISPVSGVIYPVSRSISPVSGPLPSLSGSVSPVSGSFGRVTGSFLDGRDDATSQHSVSTASVSSRSFFARVRDAMTRSRSRSRSSSARRGSKVERSDSSSSSTSSRREGIEERPPRQSREDRRGRRRDGVGERLLALVTGNDKNTNVRVVVGGAQSEIEKLAELADRIAADRKRRLPNNDVTETSSLSRKTERISRGAGYQSFGRYRYVPFDATLSSVSRGAYHGGRATANGHYQQRPPWGSMSGRGINQLDLYTLISSSTDSEVKHLENDENTIRQLSITLAESEMIDAQLSQLANESCSRSSRPTTPNAAMFPAYLTWNALQLQQQQQQPHSVEQQQPTKMQQQQEQGKERTEQEQLAELEQQQQLSYVGLPSIYFTWPRNERRDRRKRSSLLSFISRTEEETKPPSTQTTLSYFSSQGDDDAKPCSSTRSLSRIDHSQAVELNAPPSAQQDLSESLHNPHSTAFIRHETVPRPQNSNNVVLQPTKEVDSEDDDDRFISRDTTTSAPFSPRHNSFKGTERVSRALNTLGTPRGVVTPVTMTTNQKTVPSVRSTFNDVSSSFRRPTDPLPARPELQTTSNDSAESITYRPIITVHHGNNSLSCCRHSRQQHRQQFQHQPNCPQRLQLETRQKQRTEQRWSHFHEPEVLSRQQCQLHLKQHEQQQHPHPLSVSCRHSTTVSRFNNSNGNASATMMSAVANQNGCDICCDKGSDSKHIASGAQSLKRALPSSTSRDQAMITGVTGNNSNARAQRPVTGDEDSAYGEVIGPFNSSSSCTRKCRCDNDDAAKETVTPHGNDAAVNVNVSSSNEMHHNKQSLQQPLLGNEKRQQLQHQKKQQQCSEGAMDTNVTMNSSKAHRPLSFFERHHCHRGARQPTTTSITMKHSASFPLSLKSPIHEQSSDVINFAQQHEQGTQKRVSFYPKVPAKPVVMKQAATPFEIRPVDSQTGKHGVKITHSYHEKLSGDVVTSETSDSSCFSPAPKLRRQSPLSELPPSGIEIQSVCDKGMERISLADLSELTRISSDMKEESVALQNIIESLRSTSLTSTNDSSLTESKINSIASECDASKLEISSNSNSSPGDSDYVMHDSSSINQPLNDTNCSSQTCLISDGFLTCFKPLNNDTLPRNSPPKYVSLSARNESARKEFLQQAPDKYSALTNCKTRVQGVPANESSNNNYVSLVHNEPESSDSQDYLSLNRNRISCTNNTSQYVSLTRSEPSAGGESSPPSSGYTALASNKLLTVPAPRNDTSRSATIQKGSLQETSHNDVSQNISSRTDTLRSNTSNRSTADALINTANTYVTLLPSTDSSRKGLSGSYSFLSTSNYSNPIRDQTINCSSIAPQDQPNAVVTDPAASRFSPSSQSMPNSRCSLNITSSGQTSAATSCSRNAANHKYERLFVYAPSGSGDYQNNPLPAVQEISSVNEDDRQDEPRCAAVSDNANAEEGTAPECCYPPLSMAIDDEVPKRRQLDPVASASTLTMHLMPSDKPMRLPTSDQQAAGQQTSVKSVYQSQVMKTESCKKYVPWKDLFVIADDYNDIADLSKSPAADYSGSLNELKKTKTSPAGRRECDEKEDYIDWEEFLAKAKVLKTTQPESRQSLLEGSPANTGDYVSWNDLMLARNTAERPSSSDHDYATLDDDSSDEQPIGGAGRDVRHAADDSSDSLTDTVGSASSSFGGSTSTLTDSTPEPFVINDDHNDADVTARNDVIVTKRSHSSPSLTPELLQKHFRLQATPSRPGKASPRVIECSPAATKANVTVAGSRHSTGDEYFPLDFEANLNYFRRKDTASHVRNMAATNAVGGEVKLGSGVLYSYASGDSYFNSHHRNGGDLPLMGVVNGGVIGVGDHYRSPSSSSGFGSSTMLYPGSSGTNSPS